MALYLVDGTRTLVEFKSDGPSALSYPALSGSQVLTYKSMSVFLLVKELVTELFTIRYNVFRFSKNQAIESVTSRQGIHSRVMLKNDLHFSVKEIGNIYQAEDSVSMMWSKPPQCNAFYEAGKEYRTLDISAAPALLDQLAYFFPDLRIFEKEKAQLLIPNPCFITPAIKDVVNDILDCPYDERTSLFYFDVKVREYLYLLLENGLRLKNTRQSFTPYEIRQIHNARGILISDLNNPPSNVRSLAKEVGLNEARLRAGFKHFYNTTVFDYFQNTRMQKARQLLLHTNKPLKEICELVGYPRMTNFITAFRKYFGYTPASLRRNS
jgi:AraC-like DNA-binding protein